MWVSAVKLSGVIFRATWQARQADTHHSGGANPRTTHFTINQVIALRSSLESSGPYTSPEANYSFSCAIPSRRVDHWLETIRQMPPAPGRNPLFVAQE